MDFFSFFALVLCLGFQCIWVSPNVTLLLPSSLTLPVFECPWSYTSELEVHLSGCCSDSQAAAMVMFFPAIMNVHRIKAFLLPDACKVMRSPSLSILESAGCLPIWLFSPSPTEELEITWLKSPSIWSCQAFVYWLFLLKSQNRGCYFSTFLWSLDMQVLTSEVSVMPSYSNGYQIILHEYSFNYKLEVV